jgi:selenocysteine lyase/cysteine desulfurase
LQRHLENEYRLVISVRSGRLRASPYMYNTTKEIDQLVTVLPAH